MRFAGYKMPHPLIFDVHVKVETMDRSSNPIQVFERALNDLLAETDILEGAFKDAIDDYERNR